MKGLRYLVLTPGMMGADGVAELSRLALRALGASAMESVPASVDVVSLTDPPGFSMEDRGFPRARFFGAGGRRSRFVAAAVRAGFGRARPTHVLCLHVHLSPLARVPVAPQAALITFLVGIEAWKPLRTLERLALRRADLLVAISAHTARRFREANPDFRDRPIQICHLAVREKDGPSARPEPCQRMGRPAGPFALIVGRMVAEERYKGHDLLIDIWPSIVAAVPGVRLVVVGDGDDRARLEARAAYLDDHVSFRGRVSDGVLAQLYRDCAFFVMPSRGEGFGLVFLEAMHAGKACIGCVGAAGEVIVDGVTGFVVDQDREQVLRALLRLFREPELRRRMGEAGAARVAGEFTEAHFRRRFRALLGLA